MFANCYGLPKEAFRVRFPYAVARLGGLLCPRQSGSAPISPDEWWSIIDTAAYLRQTTKTVRMRIAGGELKAFRIRGSSAIRVRASDVKALLEPIPVSEHGYVLLKAGRP